MTDYNPAVSYDSTQTAPNDALRDAQAAAEASSAALEKAKADLAAQQAMTPEELVMSQDVVTQPTGLPTEVAPDFFDQFAPTIDYTVSQGEAGRGGPDSAAPTFTYEIPM